MGCLYARGKASGIEPSSLGLELSSREPLCEAFQGPLHEVPRQAEDIEVNSTPEYTDALRNVNQNHG